MSEIENKENQGRVKPLGLGDIWEFEADKGIFVLQWDNIKVGKPFMAEITGLNEKYVFERRFLKTIVLEFWKGQPSKLGVRLSDIEIGKIYEMKNPASWRHPDERTYIRVLSKTENSFEAEEINYENIIKYFMNKKEGV